MQLYELNDFYQYGNHLLNSPPSSISRIQDLTARLAAMEARAVAAEADGLAAMEARAVAAEADVQWLKSMLNASANNSNNSLVASAGPVVLAQSVEQDIRTMVRTCMFGGCLDTPQYSLTHVQFRVPLPVHFSPLYVLTHLSLPYLPFPTSPDGQPHRV